jgi:hypothetical protein
VAPAPSVPPEPTPEPAKALPRWWQFRVFGRGHVLLLSAIGLAMFGGLIYGILWWEQHPATQERVLNASRWPETTPAMRPPGRLRVLFLGNSLTQYNGSLPLILEQLCVSAGKKPAPVFDLVYKYGATWAQLWDATQAVPTIRQGHWDYVVLQDYSTAAVSYRSEMDVYARRFSREIYAVGARPLFFMTWPHQDQLKTQQQIAGAYISVSAANNGVVAPVGLAWQTVLHDWPKLILFDSRDKPAKHPTPAGSYLSACVFYSVLYHQSPHGLTGRIAEGTNVYINLSRADAMYLQDVAWKTVRETGQLAATRPIAETGR